MLFRSTKLEASPRAAATLVGTDGSVAGTTGAELFDSVVPAAVVTALLVFPSLLVRIVTLPAEALPDGFWIVTRYLGLSVADGLRTWTLLTTILGVAGFLLTWVVFALAG